MEQMAMEAAPARAAPVQQWAMVAVLTLFGTLAAIDKNLLALLVGDIKADLGISDVQMGVVIGIAFAFANAAISVPAGWLADRADRRWVVALGVVIWSTMAVGCGMARSFTQLFVARMGVGVGEGVSPPAAYSLISDGVDPASRGRAFGFYSIGGAVGGGLAWILGGALLAVISAAGVQRLPLLGSMHPWQIALVVIGLAGLPLSALAFTFPKPRRVLQEGGLDFGATLRLVRGNAALLLPLAVFSTSQALLTSAVAAWVPAMLGRTYGLAPQQIGPVLGVILIVVAPIGLFGAGAMMDRLSRRGAGFVALVAALGLAGAAAILPQVPSFHVFLLFQTVLMLFSTTYLPVTSTIVSRTMPSASIGKTMAFYLLLQGVIGAGLGPLVTALIADRVFAGDPYSLNWAISATAVLAGSTAALGALGMIRAERQGLKAHASPVARSELEAEMLTVQERP